MFTNLQQAVLDESGANISGGDYDYSEVTPLEWAEYELTTIFYDYRVHWAAQNRITDIMKRLFEQGVKET